MLARRRGNHARAGEARLDDPQLVRVAPVATTRGIRRRQHFDLKSGLKVDHKVASTIPANAKSDGPRRRDTAGRYARCSMFTDVTSSAFAYAGAFVYGRTRTRAAREDRMAAKVYCYGLGT